MPIHDYSTGEQPAPGEETWDTETLQRDYEVLSFAAPYVLVVRKSDKQKGWLQFNHQPRVYWDFRPT